MLLLKYALIQLSGWAFTYFLLVFVNPKIKNFYLSLLIITSGFLFVLVSSIMQMFDMFFLYFFNIPVINYGIDHFPLIYLLLLLFEVFYIRLKINP